MITSWFTLQKCADHFHEEYRHAVLERCITFKKNELWLIFRDKKPLIIHLGSPFQYMIQSKFPLSSKRQSVRIFPSLKGKIIDSVSMLPNDRIMRLQLKDGSSLFILFLSNRGNIIYQSPEHLEQFKKKGEIDISLLAENSEKHYNSLQEDVRFNPYWKKNIDSIFGSSDYQTILDIIASSNGCVKEDRFVLCSDNIPYLPQRFYEQYRTFVISQLQDRQYRSEYDAIERRITTQLNDIQKKLQQTRNDEKYIQNAARYSYFADTLAACRHILPLHSEFFEIPEMYRKEPYPSRISLKADIPVSDNIDRYYKKARASHTRIEENKTRHEQLLNLFEIWNAYYDSFREITDYRQLTAWKKDHADILKIRDKSSAGNAKRRPYREYVTPDNWRIWIGKSARDNDELTFKHAAKTDIWLHTRHSTGSHVIIKKDGKKDVPKHIIEYAAALAARYSDEKHASLVTVVYTLRKYVSKRKGAAAGKVHFQYEKDLMIKPEEI